MQQCRRRHWLPCRRAGTGGATATWKDSPLGSFGDLCVIDLPSYAINRLYGLRKQLKACWGSRAPSRGSMSAVGSGYSPLPDIEEAQPSSSSSRALASGSPEAGDGPADHYSAIGRLAAHKKSLTELEVCGQGGVRPEPGFGERCAAGAGAPPPLPAPRLPACRGC